MKIILNYLLSLLHVKYKGVSSFSMKDSLVDEWKLMVFNSKVEEAAFNLIERAVIYLPDDVKTVLKKALEKESSETGRSQLKAILDNVALAEKQKAPICQDTGTVVFYIKAGSDFCGLDKVKEDLCCAVRKATVHVPLRPNAVNPLTEKNSGDNTGRFMPQIHWEIVSGDCLELTVLMKGGGSENVSVLGMLNPSEGLAGLKRFILESVVKAGGQPCPPTVLGVAFGGSADSAVELAKKQLLRPLGELNADPEIARLEAELLDAANLTGLGPMGLGGKATVLAVHIDFGFRHPASFPAAAVFSCWALRRATARLHASGKIEYLTCKAEVDMI